MKRPLFVGRRIYRKIGGGAALNSSSIFRTPDPSQVSSVGACFFLCLLIADRLPEVGFSASFLLFEGNESLVRREHGRKLRSAPANP